jgi:hypothetical protein
MYKTTSKNRQKPCRKEKNRSNTNLASLSAAEDANKKRSKYFWEIERSVYNQMPLPNNIPPWVIIEIERFGGVVSWVKRNYYWQKRYREGNEIIIETRTKELSKRYDTCKVIYCGTNLIKSKSDNCQ